MIYTNWTWLQNMLSIQLFFLWSLYIVFSGAMSWHVYTKVQHFFVVSMLFTYSIFIFSHWVWDTVLLCTITITSCHRYWYVIFNFCQIRGTDMLLTCLFHMACSSYTVHSSTSIPLQFYLINLWESCNI